MDKVVIIMVGNFSNFNEYDHENYEGDICNTLKYTLVVFNVFRVFCGYNLNFS